MIKLWLIPQPMVSIPLFRGRGQDSMPSGSADTRRRSQSPYFGVGVKTRENFYKIARLPGVSIPLFRGRGQDSLPHRRCSAVKRSQSPYFGVGVKTNRWFSNVKSTFLSQSPYFGVGVKTIYKYEMLSLSIQESQSPYFGVGVKTSI